jgi:hypothetical protein
MRKFLDVYRTCIIRGWPDRKEPIDVQTDLAYLNFVVQGWRLDYLCERGLLQGTACRSLKSIFERLNKGWSDADEAGLKEANQLYREAITKSDVARGRLDPRALEGPSDDLERDRDYLKALDRLRQKARSVDAQLLELGSGEQG